MSSAAFSGSGRAGASQMVDALERPGWLTFASVVMFAVGIMRLISAISYFADSNRVNNLSLGLFGHNLFLWGLWDLAIAALALLAGWMLLSNSTFGRVIGYLWAGLVLVQSFTILNWAPWYGFAAIILAMLVIFALSSTSGWQKEDTMPAAPPA